MHDKQSCNRRNTAYKRKRATAIAMTLSLHFAIFFCGYRLHVVCQILRRRVVTFGGESLSALRLRRSTRKIWL